MGVDTACQNVSVMVGWYTSALTSAPDLLDRSASSPVGTEQPSDSLTEHSNICAARTMEPFMSKKSAGNVVSPCDHSNSGEAHVAQLKNPIEVCPAPCSF